MKRMTLMKVHALLAAFVLPVALLFVVTGALYTWGVKGSYSSTVHPVSLTAPLEADAGALERLARSELDRLGVAVPKGQPKLKVYGSHFLLEWTGSSRDVILEPTGDTDTAQLTVKDTSAYRGLVQLHKAKGGTPFKVYAALFAVALIALLVSGFVMAWQTPKLKRLSIATALVGLCSFLVVAFLS